MPTRMTTMIAAMSPPVKGLLDFELRSEPPLLPSPTPPFPPFPKLPKPAPPLPSPAPPLLSGPSLPLEGTAPLRKVLPVVVLAEERVVEGELRRFPPVTERITPMEDLRFTSVLEPAPCLSVSLVVELTED